VGAAATTAASVGAETSRLEELSTTPQAVAAPHKRTKRNLKELKYINNISIEE
jgi:hypothetical protein